MYVSIASRQAAQEYLSIVHGYRDENGKVRKKTIRSLGYLDELEKEYEDPIAHFKAVAKEMDTRENRRPTATTFASISRKSFLSAQTI